MIAEANRLPYGLAAYAWTGDFRRQQPPRAPRSKAAWSGSTAT